MFCACCQNKENFSLESVFRDLDVDGNGSIDVAEWKHGLSALMGGQRRGQGISEGDMELVFGAISGDGDEIK